MAKLSSDNIAKYRPQTRNGNKHTQRGMGMLESSMRQYGYVSPMTAAADGEIIDGSARIETSANVFGDDAIVVHHDGTKPIIMVRDDIPSADTPEARAISMAANRIAQVNLDFDAEVILGDLQAGVNLDQFWRKDELDELLADLQPKTTGDTPAEVDRAEELRQKWQTAPGQLWQLGEHRLVCGDCTDPATVTRVMGGDVADCVFTSPPYNSASELHGNDKFRGSLYLDKSIDAMTTEQYLLFNRSVFAAIKSCLADNGNVYYNISYNKNNRSGYIFVVANAIADGFNLYETIVWKKKGMPNPASTDVLTRDFEFVFLFNQSATYRTNKATNEARTNVWEISNMGTQEDNHKACFPVELPSRGIVESTQTGGIVYEPFCGSGTTIIACENLGRKCRGVELSPSYCAVALERWSVHTGKTPVLV